jgi:putative ABC transport system permease protein
LSAASPFYAVRLARRELRGGMKGLGVFLGCLVLGVTAIAAIGSIAASVTAAIKDDARDLLGGDAEARLAYRQANPNERDFLEQSGSVSEVATMRGMARTEDGTRRSLIELKAVDAAYPLYGSIDLLPAQNLTTALSSSGGNYGAAVDPAILSRLGLAIGDRIKIGQALLQIRATIVREPDAATAALIFGPRVLISAQAKPGSFSPAPWSRIATGCDCPPGSTRRFGQRRHAPPFRKPAGKSAALAKPRLDCSG